MENAEAATALILVSAFLHSVWNAILKSGSDRTAMIGVFTLTGAATAVPLMFFMPTPSDQEWLWIALSIGLHMAYQLSLTRMMHVADYSLVYPLARGFGPLLVIIISIIFLSADLTLGEMAGGFLIIFGAVLSGLASTQGKWSIPPLKALFWTSIVGTFIGLYTLVDATVVKSMHPIQFIAWSNFLMLLPMIVLLRHQTGPNLYQNMKTVWKRGMIMGIIAHGGYLLALLAFRLGELAEIAALRETSILFAALVGTLWLREKLTPLRGLGIAIIALGAVTLKAM
jgi:uncharacterized membrane protein